MTADLSTMSGADLIAAERARQIAEEGWTPEHDRHHADGALALAAACYALPPGYIRDDPQIFGPSLRLRLWPWSESWWKPTPEDRMRELVKSCCIGSVTP